MRATILFVFAVLLAIGGVSAQSPTPIGVQAASATAATSTTSVPATADVHSIPDAINLLEQIKAALERLDELPGRRRPAANLRQARLGSCRLSISSLARSCDTGSPC